MPHMPDLVTSVVAQVASPHVRTTHYTDHSALATLHKHRNEQIRDPGPDNHALWSLVNTHGGDINTIAIGVLTK